MEGFIANLGRVAKHQIERDIQKLESRGTRARPPLTDHIQGAIYELRSKCSGHGLFRIFYYQDGAASFHAFHAYQKDSKKLPKSERRALLAKYEAITGKKP